MTEWLSALGFWELLGALFVIVFLRTQATYWIARGVVSGAAGTRWGRWLNGPAVGRASALLARYGPPVVTLSFVVVGLQTVMNAAAGAARMRWWVYLVWMLPGCVAWALIYATIGFALLWALIGAAAGTPLGIAVLVLLVLGSGGFVAWRVLRARRRRGAARTV